MNLAETLKHYRLSNSEYERIKTLLRREPRGVEWALFSALWSEHCSYKSSRIHLKKFKSQAPQVLEAQGENAGVVDLGMNERLAFKMESHNHPSFISPYQGAATGVGGILRDVFTMGARPIALADYLCFGEPKFKGTEHLVDGVVRGIGDYGNCVGVPTVTGQTEFHSSYNSNNLVNAMAVGLFRPGMKVVSSRPRGMGNWVVYAGAKTGRDGIHGASMASESFDEFSEKKRPTVQIGDPFYEKLLIESCLEVMEKDLVVAIQDMGAAGLTSSSFEMASKGRVGLSLHLDRVPLRDPSLTPEDILLSESQERMLLVCEPKNFTSVEKIFRHWGLDAVKVGEITKGPEVQLFWHGEMICEIHPDLLVENVPQYERPFHFRKESQGRPEGDGEVLKTLASVAGASKEWIYKQYDQRVGACTVWDARHSIAVLRLPDSGRGLGIALGCRPDIMRRDVHLGSLDAVVRPYLELACKGFRARATTDCLNFGNPERPEVMGDFVKSTEALKAAAEALDAPIVSGNVSFYNETDGQNITPTPATGLVGIRSNVENLPADRFTAGAQPIYLLSLISGDAQEGLYLNKIRQLGELLLRLELLTARVVGRFGLAHSLSKMCLQGVGAFLKSSQSREWWFEERLYELVLVPKDEKMFQENLGWAGVLCQKLGETGGAELRFNDESVRIQDLKDAFENGWGRVFERLS